MSFVQKLATGNSDSDTALGIAATISPTHILLTHLNHKTTYIITNKSTFLPKFYSIVRQLPAKLRNCPSLQLHSTIVRHYSPLKSRDPTQW